MGYSRPRCLLITCLSANNAAPADSTTYYTGARSTTWAASNDENQDIVVPETGFIRLAEVDWLCNNASSNENLTMLLRLNDTTDYTIATVGNVDHVKIFRNSNLDLAVTIGDRLQLKFTTPAWVTNPTNVVTKLNLVLEIA